MRGLRGRLSGLCQPTYVLDIPGGHGKSPIGPNYIERAAEWRANVVVEDFNGGRHLYPPQMRLVAGSTPGRTQCAATASPAKPRNTTATTALPTKDTSRRNAATTFCLFITMTCCS